MLFAVKVSSTASRKAHRIQKLQTNKTQAHTKLFFFSLCTWDKPGYGTVGCRRSRGGQVFTAQMWIPGCGLRRCP